MPNIKIFGADGRAERIRKKIFEIFEPPMVDELVVTICPSTVLNKRGEKQPYFEIIWEYKDDVQFIIDKLRPFKLDIEVPRHLLSFIERFDHDQSPDDRLERSAVPNYEDT